MRPGALVTVAALLAIVPGCSHDDTGQVASLKNVTSQALHVERTFVGPDSRIDDVAATPGGTVVALASTAEPGAADTAFTSVDGGRTWTRHETGLHGQVRPNAYDAIGGSPELLAAGDLLIASSTPPVASLDDIGTERAPLRTQDLASSVDGGLTWNPLRLPAPRGITPIALDAIARGDTILLAGTLQRDDAVTASPASNDVAANAYDAGAWRSTDGGRSFEFLQLPAFASGDGAQILRRLLPNGDRVVAIGSSLGVRDDGNTSSTNLTMATSDAGEDWTAIGGTSFVSDEQPFWLRGDDVTQGTPGNLWVLSPRSNLWDNETTKVSTPRSQPGFSGLVQGIPTVSGEGSVLTWVADTACDCSIAEAGRYLGPRASATSKLRFDGCRDTSVRGESWVGQPVRLGDLVVAPAGCNDDGWRDAAVALTGDDGATWAVDRLERFAPKGYEHLVFGPETPHRSVATADGALIVVAQGAKGVRRDDGSEADPSATPVVFLRVTPAEG